MSNGHERIENALDRYRRRRRGGGKNRSGNRNRKTSQRIPTNRYRAHPPPTTREQYIMAKQPWQPQRTRSTKFAHPHIAGRKRPTTIGTSKQHRQPNTLTRAADGRNPTEASNDAPLPAPPTVSRERGDGHRRSVSEPRSKQPPSHDIRTTSARPP